MENTDVTYYEILGVKKTATAAEIKTAYWNLCKEYHPNCIGHDPLFHEDMCIINEAYEVLSDMEARIAYDRLLEEQRQGMSCSEDSVTVQSEANDAEYYESEACNNDSHITGVQRARYERYYSAGKDYSEPEYEEFISLLADYAESYLFSCVTESKEGEAYSTEQAQELFGTVVAQIREIVRVTKERMEELFRESGTGVGYQMKRVPVNHITTYYC